MIIKLIDGKYMIRGSQIIKLKESDREENKKVNNDKKIINKWSILFEFFNKCLFLIDENIKKKSEGLEIK